MAQKEADVVPGIASYQSESGDYVVDYNLTPEEFHGDAKKYKLPSEAGVGQFISDPDI